MIQNITFRRNESGFSLSRLLSRRYDQEQYRRSIPAFPRSCEVSFRHRLVWILICTLLCGSFQTTQSAPIPRVTKEQVQEWIKQLGARSFSVREEAEKQLWKAGKIAEEPLKQAIKAPSLEVRTRANRVLIKFRWGIYPDTPQELRALIQQYRGGEKPAKLQVIGKMFDQGERGAKTVLSIVRMEDEGFRKQLYQRITQHIGSSIPQLLIENKLSTVEALLELGIQSEPRTAVINFVSYYTLKKQLPQRIAEFEQIVEGKGPQAPELEVLLYLYRAHGDYEKARAIANRIKREELTIPLLQEQGQWQTLSEMDAGYPGAREADMRAWRMAHHRLAGNQKAYQEAHDDLMKYAADLKDSELERWYVAKSLFINGEQKRALDLLTGGMGAERKFEILCALRRYDEAFTLLDKLNADPARKERPGLEARRAQFLHVLGKTDQALKVFDTLSAKMGSGLHQDWYLTLLDAQRQVGLTERVKSQCLKQLGNDKNEAHRSKYLKYLIPGKESHGAIWWGVLAGAKPNQKPEQILEQLQNLLAGKIKDDELKKLIQSAQTALNVPQRQPDVKARWYRAIAEIALAGGDFPTVTESLRAAASVANSSNDLSRLGDLYADRKQWEEAINLYREAWEKNRNHAMSAYLRGWALTQSGKKEEGEKWKETSHWILMGMESSRIGFAQDLEKRGWNEDAERERELVRRCGRIGDFSVGEAFRQKGIRAYHNDDFLTAAKGHELAMLRVLTSYVSFVQERAYVTIPAYVHELRARGYVLAGKMEDAKKEIQTHRNLLPESINLAVGIVPLLDKKGQKKDADKLFEEVLAEQDARCTKYPQSAATLNTYCWLCAVCKRNLEKAEERARKAVSLAPKKAGYRDTLAEILFQRGNQKQAIAMMKTCQELEPDREYYQHQMKRFETGNTSAPLPPE